VNAKEGGKQELNLPDNPQIIKLTSSPPPPQKGDFRSEVYLFMVRTSSFRAIPP